MKLRKFGFALIAVAILAAVYASFTSRTEEGEQTAKKYCSSCHLFPEAYMLDKTTWKENILPVMGEKLGIRYFLDSPYEANNYMKDYNKNMASENEIISIANWQKIIKYYTEKAPATEAAQNRPPVQKFTDLFSVKAAYSTASTPSVTYVKIDEGNKRIYTGNAADSSLNIYNDQLQLLSTYDVHGVMVDMQFNESLHDSGTRSGILTNIGIMNPNDLSTGSVDTFQINNNGSQMYLKEILNNMPRPVQTTMVDLDHDGKQDYLINGFGNTKGALYWMKALDSNKYERNFIRALPGAIKTYTDDYNNDGLPDVITLMAQAQEGIYLFINRGNGTFDSKTLLQFPAVYGSSYFELDDFNNDGFKDILYTCGDNADYSYNTLKNYHGIYIFLNDGKDNFTKKYFFPIHGCYKAIARDFDNDGDLDIAAISFFPDKKNQPQESFVYLENKGNSFFRNGFQFQPYSIQQYNEGRWLTMDAADADGDGDEDIVLGNFSPPQNKTDTGRKESPKLSFLLLENKTNDTRH